MLAGEAGIGKRRLIAELATIAAGPGDRRTPNFFPGPGAKAPPVLGWPYNTSMEAPRGSKMHLPNYRIALLPLLVLAALIVSPAPASAGGATVNGRAYIDLDGDQAYTSADAQLSNLQLYIYSAQFFSTSVTDESGAFSFTGVPDGSHTIGMDLLPCADVLGYGWPGVYLYGWCPESDGPKVNVVVENGQPVVADLIQVPETATIYGHVWLNGQPAPTNTPLELLVADEVCGTTDTLQQNRGVAHVSTFSLVVPPDCAGQQLRILTGQTELYSISWDLFWRQQFFGWIYEGGYLGPSDISDINLADVQKTMGIAVDTSAGSVITAIAGDTSCGHVRTTRDAVTASGGSIPNFGGLLVLGNDARPGCPAAGAATSACIDGNAATVTKGYAFRAIWWTLEREQGLCPLPAIPDATCDGLADADDTLAILRAIASIPPIPPCFERADSNCNSAADYMDVLASLKFQTGFLESNPALAC